MKREYWTLFAICAARGEGLSPVQLQKSLFLLGKSMPEEEGGSFYNFIAYNYGPFDAAIYQDAELLADQGFISIDRPHGQRWSEYRATQSGLELAQKVRIEA